MSDLEIKKIDIKDFGCYKDYKQHSQSGIGNDFNDGKINIFYGRNYSGKSTYSKIFQSIELKQLPEKYGDIDFEIKLANQIFIKSNEIATHPDYKTKNDDKIVNYFGGENSPFIQRINNEYSHGEDRFDRTRNPINSSEFKHDARIILSALYQNDPEQFKSFLNNSNLTLPDFLEDR